MSNSFVLIKTGKMEERETMGKLNKIPEVVEVHSLYGEEYNLMIEIENGNTKFNEIIKKKLEKIPGMSIMKILNGC
jgi:DNA-binding Lrp family transcriptional regulator